MLWSKYKRKPEAWNKHVVAYFESEATPSSADMAYPLQADSLAAGAGLWHTVIVGDFSTPLIAMARSTKQKINKETQTLNDIIDLLVEKALAPHSSTLAWKIPRTEKPGVLQSMGSLRVRHNWVTSLSLFTFMHWRRKWQPIPVFLPGEPQGWRSLMGCHLRGHTESDTTEVT